MRILITGGNGQLGREWVHFLNKQGVEFISLPSSDLDITDYPDTNRVLKNLQPNLIINCAAYTKVDQAEEERELAQKVNGDAVKNLADYCSTHGVKLVHFSTDYIFSGSEKDLEKLPKGYPEDYSTQPINEYGKTKLSGEIALKESGCTYLLIRISWLCGRFGNNFVKTMLKLGTERKELSVVNDQYGSPTFTKNVVENCWQLIDQKKEGTFHLSSKGKCTWNDFATEIFAQTGIEVDVKPVDSSQFPTKAKRPNFSLLSTEKINNISGVTIIDWKDGLKTLLAELKP